jgi:hypothetical protein
MQMPVWLSKCTGPAQNLQITRSRSPYRDRMLVKRVIAGAVAVMALLPVWAGIAWSMLVFVIAAHGPDPRAPEGDPCCDYADTWGDVAFGVAWGALLAAVSVALLYATITLAGFALKGRRPKPGRLRRAIASLATVVAAFAVYTAVLSVAY